MYQFCLIFIVSLTISELGFSSDVKEDNSSEMEVEKRYESLKILLNTLNIVEQSYVQPVSTQKLIQGAINGMMKELDSHSYFLNVEELKKLETQSSGRFKGIGVDIAVKKKKLIIISVFKNSPARRAGLKPGDEIIRIDDKHVEGLNIKEVTQQLQGLRKNRKKQQLMIEVKSKNQESSRKLVLKQERIDLPSVEHKMAGDQFLYIHIQAFTERTHKEVKKVLNKNKTIRGVILDLRGNPGGLLESAVKVADLFMKKGVIVSVKGRLPDYGQIFYAHSKGTRIDLPLIVLIDSYSASAAEVLAGALKDSQRALILGRNSFGKGSVQTLIPMKNEKKGKTGIKLTVAHYYTPSGGSIHGVGIQPHIELKQIIRASQDKDSSVVLTGDKDIDFQQALHLLKSSRYFMNF